MTVTFRRLTPADFPLLRTWLQEPHVARWWNHDTSPEAVERDFGPATRGEEPSEDLLMSVDGEPIGLVQRCRLHDYPEYVAELAPLVPVPVEAISLDYLIGDPGRIGYGLGPRLLRVAVDDTWRSYPQAPVILIPVVAGNRRSWRSLEKAGAERIASGHMEPDNPIDPPLHHIYRFARD